MNQIKGALLAAFVVGFAASPGSSIPAEAAQIKAGAVCRTGGAFCLQFTSTGGIPAVARLNFRAPTPGTALVAFNGQMQCVNGDTTSGNTGVVDLTTQILTGAEQTPDYLTTGGSRFAMRIPPASPGSSFVIDRSIPINLASKRVVTLTAGPHVFVFRIVRNRMDPATKCTVWNGDFNVVFVP
jgi:hypothetical protein